VNVIGEKLKGTEAVDRTIYNIPDAAAKAASNGTDILKRIPAVQVDLSNNISLQGNSNILILIDGKERDKEFIAQLDPKSIEKVEVITNPSSKYDAGIRGVINVILKKELRAGVNGSFDVEVPTSRGHYLSSPYASLDYGTGKFRFFTSFNGHYEGFDNLKKGYRRNGNLEYTADGEGLFSYSTSTIHYGIDFFINDKNTLNLYGNYNPQQFNMDYMLDKYLKQNGTVTDYFTTDMKSHDAMRGSFYSLYYKKAFTKAGHELSLDMNFYDFHSTRNNSYLDQNYLDDLTTPDGDAVLRTETLKPTRKSFT
jgi:Outer membrane receptor for ferrienterochelin and colicins